MKFRLEHVFEATIAEIEGAVLEDPEFFAMLARDCPGISEVTLLSQQDDGCTVTREVSYRPVEGKIPGFARRWITAEMTRWTEASRYRRDQARFEYEIIPNLPRRWRDRFHSSGSYKLSPDGGRTRRVIEGVVTVRAAILGRIAEKFLIDEVKRNFAEEAHALAHLLATRKGSER